MSTEASPSAATQTAADHDTRPAPGTGLVKGVELQRLRSSVHARVFGGPADPVRIGRYTVLKRVGSGGMGVVYAAYDNDLDRKVAVKLLRSDTGSSGETWRSRMRREAQALARLSHPNVVHVYEVGEHEGQVFLAMEFVDGPNLRQWQVEERAWRETLSVYRSAAQALGAAHAAGIVHRDFKPENALVGADERLRVLDFGLARSADEDDPAANEQGVDPGASALLSPLTRSGVLMGTPAYMSPEQHRREAADARSDQFSFCVALYEALYGARPFSGATIGELRIAVEENRIEAAPRASDLPGWVRAVLVRGLSVRAGDRFPDMDALLAELAKDPAVRARRVGLAALGVAALGLGSWGWQAREDAHAEAAAGLRERATTQRERAESAEQTVVDRADALTVREAAITLEQDPTRAVALLGNLSPDAVAWGSTARLLAADARERGLAAHTLELERDNVPHSIDRGGAYVLVRSPAAREVALIDAGSGDRRLLGATDSGLPLLAFTLDGSAVVTGRVGPGVRRWPVAGGPPEPIGELPEAHHDLALAADGRVATFGRDPVVRIFGPQRHRDLPGHEGGVAAVALGSPYDVTVDGYGLLRRWEHGEPEVLNGTDPVIVVGADIIAADPGGGLLVHRPDATIQVTLDGPASSLAVHEDWIAVGRSDGRVQLVTFEGEVGTLPNPHTDAVHRIGFSDDGAWVVAAAFDNAVTVLHRPSDRQWTLRGHTGVGGWAFGPGPGDLTTVGYEGAVRTYRLDPPTAPADLALGEVSALAMTPDHSIVAATERGAVVAADGSVFGRHASPVTALATNERGRIASADAGGSIRVTGAGTPVLEQPGGADPILALAWHGDTLVFAMPRGGVGYWTPSSPNPPALHPSSWRVRSLARVGASVMAVGWQEQEATLRWFDGGVVAREVPLGEDGVLAAAISSDGSSVAWSTFTREVYVWDAAAGVRRLGSHRGLVQGVAMLPDAVLTAGDDGEVRMWALATGRSRVLARHDGPVRSVTATPDGTGIAAGTADGRILFLRDDLPREGPKVRDWVARATNLRVAAAPIEVE